MALKKRMRLDQALVELGLAKTRSEARGAIMAGGVLVDGNRVDKPGYAVKEDTAIELLSKGRNFVSRGGDKLAGAHCAFGFAIAGRRALDGGASTGGFTDYLLSHGAAHVTAIDVGYGQFAWSLRQDERVTVLERTNLRHLTPARLAGAPPSLVVLDLSFISLTKVLPAIETCAAEECEVIALVKPQFEAGRSRLGKGGIVRSAATHEAVLAELVTFSHETSLTATAVTHSPLKGPKGNIEFFMRFQRGPEDYDTVTNDQIVATVAQAHDELDKRGSAA